MNNNEVSRNLEKALQALEQAKQRVANEKKKQNEKKRKAGKPLPHNPLFPMSKVKERALSVLRQPKGKTTIPLRKLCLLPLNEAMLHFVNICVQTKAKVRLLSAHKVYECAPLPCWRNVGVVYG